MQLPSSCSCIAASWSCPAALAAALACVVAAGCTVATLPASGRDASFARAVGHIVALVLGMPSHPTRSQARRARPPTPAAATSPRRCTTEASTWLPAKPLPPLSRCTRWLIRPSTVCALGAGGEHGETQRSPGTCKTNNATPKHTPTPTRTHTPLLPNGEPGPLVAFTKLAQTQHPHTHL